MASHLGCTVAQVMQMSGREFQRWTVYLDAEQIGPRWDAVRHAQLVAAAHNSGRVAHADKRPFHAADFLTPDPWTGAKVKAPMTAADAAIAPMFEGAIDG